MNEVLYSIAIDTRRY